MVNYHFFGLKWWFPEKQATWAFFLQASPVVNEMLVIIIKNINNGCADILIFCSGYADIWQLDTMGGSWKPLKRFCLKDLHLGKINAIPNHLS